MANGRLPVRNRNQLAKSTPQWSFRVMRGIAPDQPDFETQFGLLVEHTREIIDYKKLGGLSMTLLMLDPVMRKIMGVERHQQVSGGKIKQLESSVNQVFGQSQHEECEVPLTDQFAPFGLYGYKKPYLGLSLVDTYTDEQLRADRELVIQHITETYPVDEKEIRRGLRVLKPHITLGSVKWDELQAYQQVDLRKDPSQFLRDYMREAVNKRKAEGLEVADLPMMPETICLSGLQAFRETKTHRHQNH